MRIVVTGADGFIGRNLTLRLRELGHADVIGVNRGTTPDQLDGALAAADFVFHLAGVNRPPDPDEFDRGNRAYTETLCARLASAERRATVVLASSTQAALDNPYGRSKRRAEDVVERYGATTGATYHVLRLTNVFGKWARPNYNSAIATFCHNIARGLPIRVDDPTAALRLLYVDDVVSAMIELLDRARSASGLVEIGPVYDTSVGAVVATIRSFVDSRRSLVVPRVGLGLTRALHATFLSYLPPSEFSYGLKRHSDSRGVFVEMLKTPDCGQMSYFTAGPGITRGGHYHHSKTEKFLVVQGTARFGFRNLATDEVHQLTVDAEAARVVETVPGWSHDITNVGEEEMVVLLWANEIFDPARPDTIPAKVDS